MLVWLVACGFFESADAPHFTESTPLTSPWTEMSLPLEDAKVTFSAEDTVTVQHGSQPVAELAAAYGQVLEAAGWKRTRDDSLGELVNQTWEKGDDTLALAILIQDGIHVVSLAIVPF